MKEKNFSSKKSNLITGFQPLVNDDSQILILGSFPSVKSREEGFYYGNKQNRFWKMLSSVFDEPMPQSVIEKQQLCTRHNIALWDIVIECDLTGSSDMKLAKSSYKLSDIDSLISSHPTIEKILCNGTLAYELFSTNFKTSLPVTKMSSTSPANVSYKFDIWKEALKKTQN